MTPDDRYFRNPGVKGHDLSSDPFATIADIQVEPVLTEQFGVQMAWRSPSMGLLTVFYWWDNLEHDPRLDDPDWWPVGTASEPFFDADQDWVFECWADEEFVYVQEGFDIMSWERRFRVPRKVFLAAWQDGVRRIKESVQVPEFDNHGSIRP